MDVRGYNREARDKEVERDPPTLQTVQGDMADLSAFADGSLDLVFHPVSNLFVPDVRPVWAEAFRVLRRGGSLLAGFINPAVCVFDLELADHGGELRVGYTLPYADATSLEESRRKIDGGEPLEFSHTLEDQATQAISHRRREGGETCEDAPTRGERNGGDDSALA